MKTKLIVLAIPMLIGASGVWAAEGDDKMQVSGDIGLDYLWTTTESRTVDAAKLYEYRDLSSGITGHFDLKGRSSQYYFDAFGENLDRNDQYLSLRGGEYTMYKYQLYDNRIVHNWAFDARSPYLGIGTGILTGNLTTVYTNTNTWSLFDYSQKRDDVGGMFEVSNNSPWYMRVDANQASDTGLKVIGGSNSTSPGGGFIEKPVPIDHKTQNIAVEGGYASKRSQLSASLLYSKFTNENDVLRWTNPYFGYGSDSSTLPIDNDYIRLGVNGALKQLPLGSTLSGRVTHSTTRSDMAIPGDALSTGGVFFATNPSEPTFTGEVVHTTASLSMHSNPIKALDTRIYANYFKKENNSTHVEFAPVFNSGLLCGRKLNGSNVEIDPGYCETETLSYRKSNLGADVGYRITPNNRLVLGYDYMDLRRDRIDYDETEDEKVSIEFRNTSLDFLSARLKYQLMKRRSHFLEGDAGTGTNDPEYLNRFIARFDAANVDQNMIRFVLDVTPIKHLDLSLEGIYKSNDYGDTVLGRNKDDRHQAYFSIAYGDMRKFRVMLFGDIEHVERDSYHRAIGTISDGTGVASGAGATANPNDTPTGYCPSTYGGVAVVDCFDPNSAPTNINYNWGARTHDRNWAVGIGADWFVAPRIKLSASAIGAQTDGNEAITVQAGATPSTAAIPINSYDDSKRLTFNLKGTFQAGKTWNIIGGYTYERYTFADISYDNYAYIIPSGTSTSYLSGIYAFPEYAVHIVYLTTTYKF